MVDDGWQFCIAIVLSPFFVGIGWLILSEGVDSVRWFPKFGDWIAWFIPQFLGIGVVGFFPNFWAWIGS